MWTIFVRKNPNPGKSNKSGGGMDTFWEERQVSKTKLNVVQRNSIYHERLKHDWDLKVTCSGQGNPIKPGGPQAHAITRCKCLSNSICAPPLLGLEAVLIWWKDFDSPGKGWVRIRGDRKSESMMLLLMGWYWKPGKVWKRDWVRCQRGCQKAESKAGWQKTPNARC